MQVGRADDEVGTFDYEVSTGQMTWSELLFELHGLVPGLDEPSLQVMVAAACAEDRERVLHEFHRGVSEGGLFTIRYAMRDRTGLGHELVLAAEAWGLPGDASYVAGFVLDVTGPLQRHMDQAVAASAQARAAIEQAKGAVMLALGAPEDAAWRLLRRLSHDHDIGMTELAERLTEHVSRSQASPQHPAQTLMTFIDSLGGTPAEAEGRPREEQGATPGIAPPAVAPHPGARLSAHDD